LGRFRAFLALIVAAAAGCTASGSSSLPGSSSGPHSIAHIVILFQENRSFDNLFAGFPGADTTMSGACLPAPWCKGGKIPLRAITLESTGQIGFGTDIDHSHNGFVIEYNHGGMNGFDKINLGAAGQGAPAKAYPYSYVERSETKAYWDFAKQYALADRMFFTDTAASFIAHQEILSGTVRLNAQESLTDQPDGMPWGCDAPPGTASAIIKTNGQVDEFGGPYPCFTQYGTIADLLDAKSVSWKFYVRDWLGSQGDFSGLVWNGFDAIKKIRFGPDWKKNISKPNTNVFSDIKNGALPSVSWVMPTLADSDHPASGCNHGPEWVTSVVNAIGASKYWNDTAIVLVWDDWGGWYDNVSPAQVSYTGLGFRVPMIVISPFAKPGSVSHTDYNFGSILKFIEQTFGLGSLGTTDASANSIGDIFNFTQPPIRYTQETPPKELPCGGSVSPRAIIEHDKGVPE
jgi:phospholipase C